MFNLIKNLFDECIIYSALIILIKQPMSAYNVILNFSIYIPFRSILPMLDNARIAKHVYYISLF